MTGSDVSAPPTSARSSAISRYGEFLEMVYSRNPVSKDGKFPSIPSKKYVKLAVVESKCKLRDLKELRQNTLHGRVDKMLEGKKEIDLTNILKPQQNGDPISLVSLEGPPGIGKSTLAWELCKKWDRQQYDLAVLLRLREREVQQMNKVLDLFRHADSILQQDVADKVIDRNGKGVLFILDGYDELPVNLRHTGLLVKLLKGEVLPKCCVLVTSRPSARNDLILACSPQRYIAILGFTQESIEEYAASMYSDEPDTDILSDFLVYISASKNPAINSLMYIPLNAAIIVEIYRHNRRKGCPIPITMTQVYTQLCLTLLQRYLDSIEPENTIVLNKFSDLPCTYLAQFNELSQLAFEQLQQQKIVFCVPGELVHFGFLDSVPALYGGGGISYNFLHLTLQEFLAAYHIKSNLNEVDIFDHKYMPVIYDEIVLKFVSGLTGFQFFKDSIKNNCFASVSKEHVQVRNLLLHCLFEAQITFDYMAAYSRETVFFYCIDFFQQLDRYVLGYCIANCSPTISWKLVIDDGSDESLMWGLNSNPNCKGVINELVLKNAVYPMYLASYPASILQGLHSFCIVIDNGRSLVPVIPLMRNLTSLTLYLSEYTSEVLTILRNSNLVSFKVHCHDISQGFIIASQNNFARPTRYCVKDFRTIEPLCDVLFRPSSLSKLTLHMPAFNLTANSLALLERNTCLTAIDLAFVNIDFQLLAFAKMLYENRTLQTVTLREVPEGYRCVEQLYVLGVALYYNTTLKKMNIITKITDPNILLFMSFLFDHHRVKIICNHRGRPMWADFD